jgi:hypothetical protein
MICPAVEITLVCNEARSFIYSARTADHAQEFFSKGEAGGARAIVYDIKREISGWVIFQFRIGKEVSFRQACVT